jgi:serine phosphatase RsbU (regulator of sigma subunit)
LWGAIVVNRLDAGLRRVAAAAREAGGTPLPPADAGPFDLGAFSLSDMVRCGAAARAAAARAATFEQAAQGVVGYLRGAFVDPASGGPACVLARLFVTARLDRLDPAARRHVEARLPARAADRGMRCLSLVGTVGDEGAWCDRSGSRDHLALPLPETADPAAGVAGTAVPMVAAVLRALGIRAAAGSGRHAGGLTSPERFGVFHVAEAQGSPMVPAQGFVAAYGVRSVLGFGGALPDGELFVIVLFSRVPIPAATAELFRAVAISTRLGLLGHFERATAGTGAAGTPSAWEESLDELVEVLEVAVGRQAAHLEDLVADLNQATDQLRRSQHQLERHERQLRIEAEVVETLRSVGESLSGELDLERLVQCATDAATSLTGAAFGAFFHNMTESAGGGYMLYTLSGEHRSSFDRFPMPRTTDLFAPTFRGEGIVRCADVRADPRYGRNAPFHGIPPGHLPVVSYLAVPVISPSGQVLGGFFFGHPATGRFGAQHERLAAGVAAQTAVALDNARLYQSQRDAAVELQSSLLPKLPDVDGLTIASRYLPAARGVEVGGDWVDVIPLSAGRTALVIGDVMGKGIHAAAVMGQLRTAVQAYAVLDLPPARLMRHLDDLMESLPASQLATCLYAVHDPVRQTLSMANAGHLPPAILTADRQVSYLEDWLGPPLGVGRLPFTERTYTFAPGSALLLYTDGLVERRDRGIDQGLDQLTAELAATAAAGVVDGGALLDRLVEGDAHDDDIALLYAAVPAEGVPRTIAMQFAPEPVSVPSARRFVCSVLDGWGLAAHRDTAIAIASELVANAVTHASTPLEVRLHRLPRTLVVEVADDDARLPRLLPAGPTAEHHRGLLVVQALAVRWGARHAATGKLVWAELEVPAVR